MTDFHAVRAAVKQAHEKTALLRSVVEERRQRMNVLTKADLLKIMTHIDAAKEFTLAMRMCARVPEVRVLYRADHAIDEIRRLLLNAAVSGVGVEG